MNWGAATASLPPSLAYMHINTCTGIPTAERPRQVHPTLHHSANSQSESILSVMGECGVSKKMWTNFVEWTDPARVEFFWNLNESGIGLESDLCLGSVVNLFLSVEQLAAVGCGAMLVHPGSHVGLGVSATTTATSYTLAATVWMWLTAGGCDRSHGMWAAHGVSSELSRRRARCQPNRAQLPEPKLPSTTLSYPLRKHFSADQAIIQPTETDLCLTDIIVKKNHNLVCTTILFFYLNPLL